MTTVSGINMDELPELIDTVVSHKAHVVVRYCPASEEKGTGRSPLRYRQLLEDCDRKFNAHAADCETYFSKKDHLWPTGGAVDGNTISCGRRRGIVPSAQAV